MWSDEATFNVTENQGGKVRLEPDTNIFHPKYTQRKGKYYGSVMVWGVLGHYGHGKLVVLPNTKNAIWNCCFTIWRIVFMQTRMMCSCRIMLLHITKLIKEWFEFTGVNYIKDWLDNTQTLIPLKIFEGSLSDGYEDATQQMY